MRDTLKAGRFFLPGPTEVHPDVLAAQAAPMIGHRGKAIEELLSFDDPAPILAQAATRLPQLRAALSKGT